MLLRSRLVFTYFCQAVLMDGWSHLSRQAEIMLKLANRAETPVPSVIDIAGCGA